MKELVMRLRSRLVCACFTTRKVSTPSQGNLQILRIIPFEEVSCLHNVILRGDGAGDRPKGSMAQVQKIYSETCKLNSTTPILA